MNYLTLSNSSASPEASLPGFAFHSLKKLGKWAVPFHRSPGAGNHGSSLRSPSPSVTEETDEALMGRLAGRECGALQALLERYSPIITGVIFNVIRDQAETEEVVNDVFLHSWNQASQFSAAKGKPLGWLITMARRRGIDRLRKRQRYSHATERFEIEMKHDPDAWMSGHDTARNAEEKDLAEFIKGKLRDLPPAQREAIEFAYYKGMSQREIAAHTGIPLGTIKTRLELGLKKLGVALQGLSREF